MDLEAGLEPRWLEALDAGGQCLWEWELATGTCRFSAGWRVFFGFPADPGVGPSVRWEDVCGPEHAARLRSANSRLRGVFLICPHNRATTNAYAARCR